MHVHVLVRAAKLAPRLSAELALIQSEGDGEKATGNRATLAVARKIVAWLLAVDRENREFIPAESGRPGQRKNCPEKEEQDHRCAACHRRDELVFTASPETNRKSAICFLRPHYTLRALASAPETPVPALTIDSHWRSAIRKYRESRPCVTQMPLGSARARNHQPRGRTHKWRQIPLRNLAEKGLQVGEETSRKIPKSFRRMAWSG